MAYQGLGQYNRERPDPLARRPGESQEAYDRRTAPYGRHAVEDEVWAEHRARVDQDQVGTGSGLFGRAEPTERAKAAGTHGFGGEQRLERLGHLGSISVPGSVAVPRVYLAEIEKQQRHPVDGLHSSGEGWCVR